VKKFQRLATTILEQCPTARYRGNVRHWKSGLSGSAEDLRARLASRVTIWAITGSRLASPSVTRPAPEAEPHRVACIRSHSCFRPRATNDTIASRALTNLMSASPRRPISNALSDAKSQVSALPHASHRTS
jgi:hypothetical protein